MCERTADQCVDSVNCNDGDYPCCDDLAFYYLGSCEWESICLFNPISEIQNLSNDFLVLKQYLASKGFCRKCTSCLDCQAKCRLWKYPVITSGISNITGTYFNISSGKCQQCPIGQYQGLSGCSACQGRANAVFTGPGSNDDDCPWKCNSGYYLYQQRCQPCSTDPCNVGEFRSQCTDITDGQCMACTPVANASFTTSGSPYNVDNCKWLCNQGYYLLNVTGTTCSPCTPRVCGVGYYLSKCTPNADSKCVRCTNMPGAVWVAKGGAVTIPSDVCETVSQLQVQNGTSELMNSSKYITNSISQLSEDNCDWECMEGFYRFGSVCQVCSEGMCPLLGQYRTECTRFSDSECRPCDPVPNAQFISYYNCSWICSKRLNLYLNNLFGCLPCNVSNCPLGQYMSECTEYSDSKCTRCDPSQKPVNAHYVQHVTAKCEWVCNNGYFALNGSCLKCSTLDNCPRAKQRDCTQTADSYCSECNTDTYQVISANLKFCIFCTTQACDALRGQYGTSAFYLSECGQYEDRSCFPCTRAPSNAIFEKSDRPYTTNNCSWSCPPGYERTNDACNPCLQGTYSTDGKTCQYCDAGKYSTAVKVVASSSCNLCSMGSYSNVNGASSSSTCRKCSEGKYQSSAGSTSCDDCPVDTYGVSKGSSSQTDCMMCPLTSDTANKVGQVNLTSCLCKKEFYRFEINDICHPCPSGLRCFGNSTVEFRVPGSNWIKNGTNLLGGEIFQLTACPAGYRFKLPSEWPYSADIEKDQSCTECPAGKECTSPPCEECSPCKPGTYKGCSGTENCSLCEVGSYEPRVESIACQQCADGFSTNKKRGSISAKACTCDTAHYRINQNSSKCTPCPIGLTCFGNETVYPKGVYSNWTQLLCQTNSDEEEIYFLTYCPQGYYISQPGCSQDDPQCRYCNDAWMQIASQQCIACPIGNECTNPPCINKCNLCLPGFWKSKKYPSDTGPEFYINAIASPDSGSEWITEPCAKCPPNTYRQGMGGTEIGGCSSCPPRSTTNGLNGQPSIESCMCEPQYYLSVDFSAMNSSDVATKLMGNKPDIVYCQSCSPSALCDADRSCALRLVCPNTSTASSCRTDEIYKLSSSLCPAFSSSSAQSSGLVPDSIWKIVGPTWRLLECPAGYTFSPGELGRAENDKCIPCSPGYYLMTPTRTPDVQCLRCPVGSTCPGLNVVIPSSGFWMSPSSNPASRRAASNATDAMPVQVFKCPIGACSGTSCLKNRVGPVCGLCAEGSALGLSGCTECLGESAMRVWRIVAIVLGSLVLFAIWLFLSWSHVLSCMNSNYTDGINIQSVKSALEKANKLENMRNMKEKAISCSDQIRTSSTSDLHSKLQLELIAPYFKIFVTFYQILSAFLTFNVEWPNLLVQMMVILKVTVFLDLFKLPVISCLWAGASFQSRLLLYTLVPLVVIFCFGLPLVVLAAQMSWKGKADSKLKLLWNKVFERFQFNMNFFLFLIYSTVSMVTLESFNCNPQGLGLLAADYRESCPEANSFLRIYSIIFIFVYPVGIPLFVGCSLILMGVPVIQKDKYNVALVSSMIHYFMKMVSFPGLDKISSSELQKVAAKLIDLKAKEGDPGSLNVNMIHSILVGKESPPDDETSQIIRILKKIVGSDKNGNINVTETQFKDMTEKLVVATQIFSGSESGDTLTKNQAAYLLVFCKSDIDQPDASEVLHLKKLKRVVLQKKVFAQIIRMV